jgi:hypothetical protein
LKIRILVEPKRETHRYRHTCSKNTSKRTGSYRCIEGKLGKQTNFYRWIVFTVVYGKKQFIFAVESAPEGRRPRKRWNTAAEVIFIPPVKKEGIPFTFRLDSVWHPSRFRQFRQVFRRNSQKSRNRRTFYGIPTKYWRNLDGIFIKEIQGCSRASYVIVISLCLSGAAIITKNLSQENITSLFILSLSTFYRKLVFYLVPLDLCFPISPSPSLFILLSWLWLGSYSNQTDNSNQLLFLSSSK